MRSYPTPGAYASAVFVVLSGCRGADHPRGAAALSSPGTAGTVRAVVVQRPQVAFDGALRIASVFPTVGRYARSGIESHRGARLAVEDINASGGIAGRPLRLLEYGTGSYFLDAGEAARLAVADGALALVGSNASSLSRAVAAVAEETHVVQVSNVSTAPDLTWDPVSGRDRPYVFRMCGSDELMGTLLADFARNVLGAHRAAVVYEVGRAYSVSLARSFLRRFLDDAPRRAAAPFVYLSLQTDFRPQLKAAAAFRPDVLFLPGSFTDATLVAAQAEGLGFQATLLGGDGWSSPLLFKRGGPPENAYYGSHCRVPEPFAARYSRTFGEISEGCRALLAHDAVRALAAALQEMGPLTNADLVEGVASTRERLRQRLTRVRASGESGPIRFDERGDVSRGIAVTEVVRGPGGYLPRHIAWLRTDQ